MQKTITLAEALTGVDFIFNHLDGSQVRVKNKPGEVIKPDDLKTLVGKGLPFHKRSYETGNLYIKFSVTFPDTLTKAQMTPLLTALGKSADDEEMDGEACLLTTYSESQRNTHAQGGTKAADSEDDEEDEGHGQG